MMLTHNRINTMPKQKLKQLQLPLMNITRSAVILVVAAVFIVGSFGAPRVVEADSLEEQVRALEQENESNLSALERLLETATSYENAIERLESQIAQLQ